MNNCVFCKVGNGNLPSFKIYETENYLAFLDLNPIVEGHTLLIPKKHVETITELSLDALNKLGSALVEVEKILIKKYDQNINIYYKVGKYASQEVPHAHYHFLPRKKVDRLWDKNISKIVLDKSSEFERLIISKEELSKLHKELTGENK
ncbi:MAG: HIT family protein [Nanoarchaeota archaeon]|nr:HIT family protein [Nanoarchaeota archaeon]